MNGRAISLCRGFLVGHLGTMGYRALAASPEHQLCMFLENSGQDRPLGKFPSKYICRHAEEQFGCWRSDNGVDDIDSKVANASLTGPGSHIFVETVRNGVC